MNVVNKGRIGLRALFPEDMRVAVPQEFYLPIERQQVKLVLQGRKITDNLSLGQNTRNQLTLVFLLAYSQTSESKRAFRQASTN
jgi:hypothetical protein